MHTKVLIMQEVRVFSTSDFSGPVDPLTIQSLNYGMCSVRNANRPSDKNVLPGPEEL